MKRLLTLGLVILLMTSIGASAQTATGNVYGKTTDSSGAVLPGASVTISGEAGSRTTVTGADGTFRFLNLSPSEYTVTVSMQGFGAANRKVLVQTGQSASLEIGLKVGGQAESIEVTAEAPLVDVKKRGTSSNLTTQDLESVPTARDPWAVLNQIPGAMVDRVNIAGNEAGQQAVFTGKGATPSDSQWNLDGIVVTDMAANGSSPAYYDFEVFQEINVTTGGGDVTKQTGGMGMNLVTKRGTNQFHGGARFLDTDNKWQSSNIPDALKNDPRLANRNLVGSCGDKDEAIGSTKTFTSLTGQRDKGDSINWIKEYGFDLGGPIIKDKLWFYGSYGKQDIHICRFAGTPDETLLPNYSAKLNWQANGDTMVSLFYFLGAKKKFGRSLGLQLVPTDGTLVNQDGAYTEGGLPKGLTKLEINHTFSPSFFMSAKAAYYDTGFGLTTRGKAGQGFTYDYVAGETIGTALTIAPLVRPQKNLNVDGSYFFQSMGGNNELKFGFGYRDNLTNSTTHYNGLTGYYNGPGTAGGQNVATVSRDANTIYDARYASAYVGDVFTKDRFTLNVGLRFDNQKAKNEAASVPANADFPGRVPALNYAGSDYIVNFTDLSPRLGFSYALNESRKTVIRGSLARYGSSLSAGLVVAENPVNTGGIAYDWNDRNGDKIVQASEVGSTIQYSFRIDPANPAKVGETVNKIDRDLTNSHDNEAILGLDHELGANFAIGGAVTYRKTTNFIATGTTAPRLAAPCPTATNCAVIPASAYTALAPITRTVGSTTGTVTPYAPPAALVTAGAGGRYTTNRDGYSRQYVGFEATLNKRLSNKWGGRVSFSYNDWTEHWEGTPTSLTLNPTRLSTDPLIEGGPVSILSGGSGKASFYSSFKWQLYVNGIVQLPASFDLSAQIFGRQGGTFPISINAARGGDGTAGVQLGNVDDQRYDNLWNVDLRLARNAKVGRVTITPAFELFNALNNDLVLSKARNLGSAATFGRIEELISPRVARISARITF